MRTISIVAGILAVASVASTVTAQSLAELPAGVHVRAVGERVGDKGVEPFALSGIYRGSDPAHIMIGHESAAMVDTIPFVGINRLHALMGYNSRSSMVLTGAAVGLVTGAVLWLGAKNLTLPETTMVFTDQQGRVRAATVKAAPIVNITKIMIPVLGATGIAFGATVGSEQWVRITVPGSIFDQKR